MKSENTKKALKIISERNQKARATASSRYGEILEKIPRAREIYNKLAETSRSISNVIFSENANKSDVSSLIEQIKIDNIQLQKELEFLLGQNGYQRDYLETHFTCSICEDTGYVKGYKCSCLKNLVVELGVAEFNSSSTFQIQRFIDFSLNYYSDTPQGNNGNSCKKTMSEIFDFCKLYAEKFHTKSPSILMLGETGLGKTHLSLSIANEITKKGFTTVYSSSLDLFRVLQNEYFGKSDIDRNTIQTVIDADLVIIDDLGAEFESAFNCSSLYNIINSRLNASKPTIINTNLTPSEIERRYTNRVASRLMTLYKCLKFVGKDVRQIKLKNNEY